MESLILSWVDYLLFGIMTTVSIIIGIYFGFFQKQDTTTEYLLGGKNMKAFPVGISLAATTLSGVAILGFPTEIYMFGTQFFMTLLSIFIFGIIANYIYLPVFYDLQVQSSLDYLEMRFGKSLARISSVLYYFSVLFPLPAILYAPSLAVNQMTGYNIYIVAAIMSIVCIFYTSIGGFKAVVWADTLQFCVSLGTLTFLIVMGAISVGGFSIVWNKLEKGNRIEFFNMDPDPTIRNTFWTVVVGNTFTYLFSIAVNPVGVQRFIAVSTQFKAKMTLLLYVTFSILTKLMILLLGMIIYTQYSECDPLKSGKIRKPDQLLPFYVMDLTKEMPGISGLFLGGLFCTSLSSLSSFYNTLSGVLYSDIIKPFMPIDTTEKTTTNILKILTVVIGIVFIAMVYVIDKLGSIIQILFTLYGVTGGPLLGLFTLGMFFPSANKKGAFAGALTSFLLLSFVVIRTQIYVWNHELVLQSKPLYTYGCTENLTTVSMLNTTNINKEKSCGENCNPGPSWLFRISFYYSATAGCLLTLVVGLVVSWMFRKSERSRVDPSHITPIVRRFMLKSKSNRNCGEHTSGLMNNVVELKKIAPDTTDPLILK